MLKLPAEIHQQRLYPLLYQICLLLQSTQFLYQHFSPVAWECLFFIFYFLILITFEKGEKMLPNLPSFIDP